MTTETQRKFDEAREGEKARIQTLGDELPKEIARCRELLTYYTEIGLPGRFGYAMISLDIKSAEAAIAANDVVAMIRAYEALKGCK